ncbi:MAG TPA: hypothetical protein PLF29_01695 [bacterium]|nr:hypothetical protein [bacterium]
MKERNHQLPLPTASQVKAIETTSKKNQVFPSGLSLELINLI